MNIEPKEIFAPDFASPCALPIFLGAVQAGFPSPADDFIEGKLDLNRHLIKNQAATFFVRAVGDSMIGAGIHPGDILVVDRSIRPYDKCVVVAVLSGEFTVKRLRKKSGRIYLLAENSGFKPILVEEAMDFQVWGVVTSVVHKL